MARIFTTAIAALALSTPTVCFSGNTILTVSGDIHPSGGETIVEFDLQSLQTLPLSSFETTTIWTEGTHFFEGVSVTDLMEHVGANQGTILAVALNDYAISIPTSDATQNGPIIAYRLDGREMHIRDRGPLWVVYPFDSNDDYRSEEYYSRSIWQLNRIEFVSEN